jgi:hypothetical protein
MLKGHSKGKGVRDNQMSSRIVSSKTSLLSSLLMLSICSVVISPQISFANHGQEISISLDNALFIPLSVGGNQVNVLVNYTVNDSSLLNQEINSVMKVYMTNTTLIKTSSSPDGFIVNQTGLQRHATTITDSKLQNVTAVIQFTDLTKTDPLSNPLRVDLTLNKTGSA